MLVTKDASCSRLIILLPSGAGAAARTGCSYVERLWSSSSFDEFSPTHMWVVALPILLQDRSSLFL